MFAYLKGKLTYKDPSFVIIDVNGIGYEVRISLNTFSKIGDNELVQLHTHFYVKEDSQQLFGFFEASEKKVFQLLISISGVGPGTAIMVLSSLSSEELKRAIATDDVRTIQSVKGIGAKTAQRIILELRDKLPTDLLDKSQKNSGGQGNTIRQEALSALSTLGFNKPVAEKAIDKVLKEHGYQIQLEELIKHVLKSA